MNLISEWKHVLRHAWSFRFSVLSAINGLLEIVLPIYVDALPRGIFAGLSVLSAGCGAIARVVDQPKMERRSMPRHPLDPARHLYD
jgi:hypothetical protein